MENGRGASTFARGCHRMEYSSYDVQSWKWIMNSATQPDQHDRQRHIYVPCRARWPSVALYGKYSKRSIIPVIVCIKCWIKFKLNSACVPGSIGDGKALQIQIVRRHQLICGRSCTWARMNFRDSPQTSGLRLIWHVDFFHRGDISLCGTLSPTENMNICSYNKRN